LSRKRKKIKENRKKGKTVSIYIFYIWSLEIQVVSVFFLFASDIEIPRCQYKNTPENYNILKEIESHALSILPFN